jgi:uncharacterized protein GlcG (DUF336 family)
MKIALLVGLAAIAAGTVSGVGLAAEPAPPAPAMSPPEASTDPTRLPGDRVMPRGVHRPPPPPGANGRPPPEPGTDAPGPSLALAIEAAQAAIAACKADGYSVGVSVIDSSGQPRVALSADGATGGHVYTGIRKGLAALSFKEPTSQLAAQAESDPTLEAKILPNMAPMAGAVPLKHGSTVIGAIGVSGASSLQDEKCAIAGARRIQDRLK